MTPRYAKFISVYTVHAHKLLFWSFQSTNLTLPFAPAT